MAASPIAGLARRAASYVRMSTDHQRFSIENQSETIEAYARCHDLAVVKTYADAARSGLTFRGRPGLQALIADVEAGQADYEVLLVYDVSRWGRFQDIDESAYYEYICRRAGVGVIYCTEPFENNGSPTASIIKSVKRAMAGEYSRDLSRKIFAGHCRMISRGFWQGGMAGFGLRRLMIDQDGNPQAILDSGQRKGIQNYRVVLTAGPPHEVEIVRRIFQLFVEDGARETAIARQLNEAGVVFVDGRPWLASSVRGLLTNEKYIGRLVYNRSTSRLQTRKTPNSRDHWLWRDDAHESLVERAVFDRAAVILEQRAQRFTEDNLVRRLRDVIQEEGKLSAVLIDERPEMPHSATFANHFGGLRRAYSLVGYVPARSLDFRDVDNALQALRPSFIDELLTRIGAVGGRSRLDASTGLIELNGELTVSVIMVRSVVTANNTYRWRLRLETEHRPDITLVVRMDTTNAAPMDYYLFPKLDVLADKLRLGRRNELCLDAYRFESLEVFDALAARSSTRSAA